MHNDQMKNIILLILLFFLFTLMLFGCSPIHYKPPSIATPGSIDQVISKENIPEIKEWKHDDHMLVYRPDCNECRLNAALFSWDWHNDQPTELPLPGTPTGRLDAVESLNSNIIAYAVNDTVYLYNLISHSDKKVADGRVSEFSPDGSQLIYYRNLDLYTLDLQLGLEKVFYNWRITKPEESLYLYGFNWSPDGKRIAYIKEIDQPNGEREVFIAYIDVSKKQEFIVEKGRFIGWVSWSPDSRLLAYIRSPITNRAELIISEPSRDCIVSSFLIPGQDGTSVWSPDGKVILVRYYGDLYFINVEKVFGKPFSQLNCTK